MSASTSPVASASCIPVRQPSAAGAVLWLLFGLVGLATACGDDSHGGSDADADVEDRGEGDARDDAVDAEPDVEPDGETDVPADGDGDLDTPEDGDGEVTFRPCSPATGAGTGLTLRGTVLTPETVIPDGEVLLDTATGLIRCVAEDCSGRPEAAEGTLLCTDGIVLPGLIDAHDHIQYGHLPRWRHPRLYLSRYDWQSSSGYWDFMRAYDEVQGSLMCELMKYSETRMALGGATSGEGSAGAAACVAPILRNLDKAVVHGFPGWEMEESVPRISGTSAAEAAAILAGLRDGSIDAYVPHIGEGIDDQSRAEYDTLYELGLIVPGTSIIHGTGGGTIELARLAAQGVGLIWSPRSNTDLYGLTTNVSVARAFGVPIAIGPDWTPSGSWSVLDEMKCVDDLDSAYFGDTWTDQQIVESTTSVAADLYRIDPWVGRLEEGLMADVTVIRGDRTQPYRTVIDALSDDVALVLRNGRLLAGDEEFAAPLATAFCESLDVCGTLKTVCIKTSDSSTDRLNQTLADITRAIHDALETARTTDPSYDPADLSTTYQYDLAPLFLCEPPPPCTFGRDGIPGVPTAEDGDGDGILDGDDLCPDIFDPAQADLDGDGTGDSCDPCPLDADLTLCSPPDAADIDRDGVPDATDNCVGVPNTDQADTDGDGTGDACELAPITIYDIQDLARPRHPLEGSAVEVHGVNVTALWPTNGCFVQEPGGGPYSGILAYADGDCGVAIGDVVDVTGTYTEYSGESEINDAVVTRVSAGTALLPDTVSSADVSTTGAMAEPYEGVLVRIEAVTVTNANPDAPSDYNEFSVTGNLRVDDAFYRILPDPVVGDAFLRITGILRYTYSNTKLEPRSAADVER